MSIEKNELMKLLNEAADLEGRAIPIYSRHLKTALFWSGLAPASREQLRILLGVLEKEAASRCKVLLQAKNRIEEDARDVF